MGHRGFLLFVITLLGPILFLGNIAGETEPNDSLDDPEVITAEIISGELNTNETNEDDWEKDIFRKDMEEDTVNFFIVEKTNENNSVMTVEFFDENKTLIEYERSMELDIPGETTGKMFVNSDGIRPVFLAISGQGNYRITVYSRSLDDPNEPEDDLEDPPVLEDGEFFSARVSSISYHGLSYEDIDNYIIRLEEGQDVSIEVRKTGSEEGNLSISLCENRKHGPNSVRRTLEFEGDRTEIGFEGYRYEQSTLHLRISGNGEYEILVDTEDEPEIDPGIMIGLIGGIVCFSIVLSLAPYIIVAFIVIFLVVNLNKKKKKKDEKKKKKK